MPQCASTFSCLSCLYRVRLLSLKEIFVKDRREAQSVKHKVEDNGNYG